MLKPLWQQLPHMSAIFLGVLLIVLAVRFPYNTVADHAHRSAQQRRKEILVLTAFTVVLLLLRVAYVFRYHIDSDEPQHLHVVWAWTQGLLPYRDVFDNHMPLFHLLCAPLLAALGERADILYFMRLAMIPLYGITMWGIYRIGCVLFSPRIGRWAAIFTGLFPGFFFCSIEFRTDDLWTALWIGALSLMVRNRMTLRRSVLVGLLLGAALSVSMKTTLLLGALGAASILSAYVSLASGERFPVRPFLRYAPGAIGGVVLLPVLLIVFFVAQGAWAPFWYGTIQHNIVPGLGHWRRPYLMLIFPFLLFLMWRGAQAIARGAPDARVGKRRILVFLATAGYAAALFCFWPLWTREDYLPFYPPFVLLVTPVVFRGADWSVHHGKGLRSVLSRYVQVTPVSLGVIEIILLLLGGPVWRDKTRDESTLLTDVLRLTEPDDSVADLKGETVFRPRSSYYVLEGITRARMKYGLLPDDIPDRLVAARTCVAVGDDYRFPVVTRAFLHDNYLPVGPLRVCGQWLGNSSPDGANVPFTIIVPSRYAIVAEHGTVTGWLDGTPYDGARALTPGLHEFCPTTENGRLAAVWAQASERGFSPFGVHDSAPLRLATHASE